MCLEGMQTDKLNIEKKSQKQSETSKGRVNL